MKYLSFLLLFSPLLLSQPPQRLIYVTVDATIGGTCTNGQAIQWNPTSGNLIGCVNSVWTKLNGSGGGGSGTVTSVTIAGTSNEITATGTCTGTTTISCTLSVPSGFILPGTINGLTITTTTGTITVSNAKVISFSNSLSFVGTDGVILIFPSTNATIARTDASQSFTGLQTFLSGIATGSGAPAITGTGIIGLGESTGQACVTLTDCIIANSTNHQLLLSNNNATAVPIAVTPATTTNNNIPQYSGTSGSVLGTGLPVATSSTANAVVETDAGGTINTNFVPTLNQNTTGNAATATNISTSGTSNQVWGMNSGASAQGWQTVGGGGSNIPFYQLPVVPNTLTWSAYGSALSAFSANADGTMTGDYNSALSGTNDIRGQTFAVSAGSNFTRIIEVQVAPDFGAFSQGINACLTDGTKATLMTLWVAGAGYYGFNGLQYSSNTTYAGVWGTQSGYSASGNSKPIFNQIVYVKYAWVQSTHTITTSVSLDGGHFYTTVITDSAPYLTPTGIGICIGLQNGAVDDRFTILAVQ